jgi:hypothetical protein
MLTVMTDDLSLISSTLHAFGVGANKSLCLRFAKGLETWWRCRYDPQSHLIFGNLWCAGSYGKQRQKQCAHSEVHQNRWFERYYTILRPLKALGC